MSQYFLTNAFTPMCTHLNSRGNRCTTHSDRFCCALGFIFCLNCMEKFILPSMAPEEVEQFNQAYSGLVEQEQQQQQEKQRQVDLAARREHEAAKARTQRLGLVSLRQLAIAAPPAYVSYILPLSLALAALRESTPVERRNDDFIVNWLLAAAREQNPDGTFTQPYLCSMLNAMINNDYCFKMACEICAIARFIGISSFAINRCESVHRLLRIAASNQGQLNAPAAAPGANV